MKYSKLFVAGAAALALAGCYSAPSISDAPDGNTGPVGYNGSGSSDTAVGMAGDTKPDGTGTYETKAKGSTESASR